MATAIAGIRNREHNIQSYATKVMQFPMLTATEEYELALRNRDHGDQKARQRMLESHLRYVIKMAFAYKNYGLEMEDLISEGNIGLDKAIEKFTPEMGNRLSTYASWWVKASIQEFVFNNSNIIKISNTSKNKQIVRALTRARAKILNEGGNPFTHKATKMVADELGLAIEDVKFVSDAMGKFVSLNSPMKDGKGAKEDNGEIGDMVADEAPSPEDHVVNWSEHDDRMQMLKVAMETLGERERSVFMARRLNDEPETLEELGSRFNVSRERIRQIEVSAFEKVEESIKRQVADARWKLQNQRFDAIHGKKFAKAEPEQVKVCEQKAPVLTYRPDQAAWALSA